MQGLANLTGYLLSAMGLTVLIIWPEGGPGADGAWFTDDDVQSNYGGNEIIYCGYRYDAETQNYYVRNRYYSPVLGRWVTRDPIGYEGGINLYGYVESSPVAGVDWAGLARLGQRRIVGDTFALRPALLSSSPGAIHSLQRALRDLGLVTAVADLPNAANDFWEVVTDYQNLEIEEATPGEFEAAEKTAAELEAALAKLGASKLLDKLEEQVKDSINDMLKGFDGPLAQNQGVAIWVRVKYQQYQEVNPGIFAWPPFCPRPEWVTHHQWVRVPYAYAPVGADLLKGYGVRNYWSIAKALPWACAWANNRVLAGGKK